MKLSSQFLAISYKKERLFILFFIKFSCCWNKDTFICFINKSSIARWRQLINRMTNVIHFNVGGKQFKVSRSLLEMHINTLLTQMSIYQLQSKSKKVILPGDGIWFRFILDYLHCNGFVTLPMTVTKETFSADLAHFQINVAEAQIFRDFPLLPNHRQGSEMTSMLRLILGISTMQSLL